MASILHPGLRYSRLDYPALSGPFSLFLRVCHCLADDESSGARTMSGS